MGGKASKSKSVDITTPPAEGAEDQPTLIKEGNGEISSEPTLIKAPEETNENEGSASAAAVTATEEAEKPSDKEKDKEKEKDKDKEKDKEKSKEKEEKKEKKKDKKRSFSFLSKKQKKSKEGSNGDVEGKVAQEEAKTEAKSDEAAAAAPATDGEEAQTESSTKSEKPEGAESETTATASENVEEPKKSVPEPKESEVAAPPEPTKVESEEVVAKEATVVVENQKSQSPVKEPEIAKPEVEEIQQPQPEKIESPQEVAETIVCETADNENEIQTQSPDQMKCEETPTICPNDTSNSAAVVIPPPVFNSCSESVEAEVVDQVEDLPVPQVDDEVASESSQTFIPEPPVEVVEDEDETAAETFDIPAPIVDNMMSSENRALSPIEIEIPPYCNSVPTTDISPPKDDSPVQSSEVLEDGGKIENLSNSVSNRSSLYDTVDPITVDAVEDSAVTKTCQEVSQLPVEIEDSEQSPALLAEPVVVVQAATPEPLSDENVEPVISLPSPPALIEGSSSSSLESVEKIPSPPPANEESDSPLPTENSIHDNEMPSPDEVHNQSVLKKTAALMETKITWKHGGSEVSMTGSFLNWIDNLELSENDGVFSVAVDLPEGEHYCKFLVDGSWTVDSAQPVHELDGQGQVNVIMVKVGNPEE